MGYNRDLRLGAVGDVLRWRVLMLTRRQGLTREHFSRRLRALGVTLSTGSLREIEYGTRRVSVDELVGLASALGVQSGDLLLPAPLGDGARMSELEATADRVLRSTLIKAVATEEALEGDFRRWLSTGQIAKLGLKQRDPESLLAELEAVRAERERMEAVQKRRDQSESFIREGRELDQEAERLQAAADERVLRGEYGFASGTTAYLEAEARIEKRSPNGER